MESILNYIALTFSIISICLNIYTYYLNNKTYKYLKNIKNGKH